MTDCFDYQFGSPIVAGLPLDAPASINIETLTECDLLLCPIAAVNELLKSDVTVAQMYNTLLVSSMKKHLEPTTLLTQYPATQRYQWFLSEYEGLKEKVNDKYIASFLNMSHVTLSRIRGELRLSGLSAK